MKKPKWDNPYDPAPGEPTYSDYFRQIAKRVNDELDRILPAKYRVKRKRTADHSGDAT